MSRFTPIDPAMTLKKPVTFRGEKYRDVGHHTQEYLYTMDQIDDPGYFANSWGYTIFRTDYSTPSESFARAVKLLTTYAGNWLFDDLNPKWRPFDGPPIDPRAMYEVRSRLYNAVVEDQATLENATIEEVGRQFDLWITRNRDEDEADGPPSARFLYCIMLDKESIENLLALPDQPNQVQAPDIWYVWVKVITNEVRDGRRLWLRVGVYDVLWEHWFTVVDPEIQFEEMIGDYDEEGGVCNLYGPPTGVPKPGDPIPMDTRPGHPTRRLAGIPYPRLTPP